MGISRYKRQEREAAALAAECAAVAKRRFLNG